jgi:hypothetical protein
MHIFIILLATFHFINASANEPKLGYGVILQHLWYRYLWNTSLNLASFTFGE